MKKICQWLCPKKEKSQGPYDVHEETFEMSENIGDIEGIDKFSDPTARQSDISQSQHKQESAESLTSNIIINEHLNNSHEDERKFMENKNKVQSFQQKNQIKPQVVQPKQQYRQPIKQQKQSQIQPQPEVVQQKPKPKYNILNTGVKKKKFNPADYCFKQQQNQFKVKPVDSLKGQQFNIDKCKGGMYFIFDITANIYIDDCQDCFIFAAPVESSIFVRNCKNMVIVAAVGQFRTYNCHNAHFSIYCKSQPVIESSSEIYFSTLECPEYLQLRKQFEQAKLEPLNNNWSQIHNFTKKQGQTHYYLHKIPQINLNIDWQRAFKQANLEIVKQKQQIVPFIQGALSLDEPINQALLIFGKQQSEQEQQILQWVKRNNILLLRASKTKVSNQAYYTIALLIKYEEGMQLDFGELGQPTFIAQEQEIKENYPKYFVAFKDQR